MSDPKRNTKPPRDPNRLALDQHGTEAVFDEGDGRVTLVSPFLDKRPTFSLDELERMVRFARSRRKATQ